MVRNYLNILSRLLLTLLKHLLSLSLPCFAAVNVCGSPSSVQVRHIKLTCRNAHIHSPLKQRQVSVLQKAFSCR